MELKDLNTKEEITWCPGCPNHAILSATKKAIAELVEENQAEHKDFVSVGGIGCHAKTYDYINISGYYSLHGRVLPSMLGVKIGNPDLKVIGFAGDGDTYEEGTAHFVHNCRYNANMTFLVHNNQVFALTVGQYTSTSEKGFRGKVTPLEERSEPLNPLKLALTSGATFVARGYALEIKHLTELIKKAILHEGFAFIDIIQPCLIFHDTRDYMKDRLYKLEEEGCRSEDYQEAFQKAAEWDYSLEEDKKVPIGLFYQKQESTFQQKRDWFKGPWYQVERKSDPKKIVSEFAG